MTLDKASTDPARRPAGGPPWLRCGWTVWIVLALLPPLVRSQPIQSVSAPVGQVEVLKIQGRVTRVGPRVPAGSPILLTVGTILMPGERIRAQADSFATLGLADGSWVEVQPNTELEILDLTGGIRELLRLWIGKVRIHIRKLTGAPNPYQMHTPIATIGVRGTEFEITVAPNSVTTVKVLEGTVTVKDLQTSASEIVVPAGREITIYPLRPPDPPITLEQVVAQNFSRESSVDHPVLRKFLAFADPHLDMLDNPAYISQFTRPGGRFYLYPARSTSFSQPEISPLSPIRQFTDIESLFAHDSRRLEGLATRVSYAYPTNNWVWAGLFEYRGFDHDFHYRFSREVPTAFGNVTLNQVGQSFYAPDLQLDSRTTRTFVAGARRFPGQTFAAAYDWTRSRGNLTSLFTFGAGDQQLMSESTGSLFSQDNRRFSFGYHRENDTLGSFALSYKIGFISGRAFQQEHEIDGGPATLADFGLGGRSHETSVEWRKRLHRNWTLAVSTSLTRFDLHQQVQGFRTADSTDRSRLWIPSLGVGLGFNWRDRVFAALDVQTAVYWQQATRSQWTDGRRVSLETNHRTDNGIHGWLQFRLPRGFFAGGGFTSFWSRDQLVGHYEKDWAGRRTDAQGRVQPEWVRQRNQLQIDQTVLGIGKAVGASLYLEYQISSTWAPRFRPFGQSFLLRFAF